jgi:hypothetical protein
VTPAFRFEPLGAEHDRAAFCCGVDALDRYFQSQVTEDICRRVTNCFVALAATGKIAGFYTLASAGIPVPELPPELAAVCRAIRSCRPPESAGSPSIGRTAAGALAGSC